MQPAPGTWFPVREARASDAERERCASLLRDAFAEGRLELGELEGRLDRARAARTRWELRGLVADLPREHVARAGRALDRLDRLALRAHATVFGGVSTGLTGLWAAFGQGDYWPAWIVAPAAAVLATHAGGSWTVRRLLRRR